MDILIAGRNRMLRHPGTSFSDSPSREHRVRSKTIAPFVPTVSAFLQFGTTVKMFARNQNMEQLHTAIRVEVSTSDCCDEEPKSYPKREVRSGPPPTHLQSWSSEILLGLMGGFLGFFARFVSLRPSILPSFRIFQDSQPQQRA